MRNEPGSNLALETFTVGAPVLHAMPVLSAWVGKADKATCWADEVGFAQVSNACRDLHSQRNYQRVGNSFQLGRQRLGEISTEHWVAHQRWRPTAVVLSSAKGGVADGARWVQ